MAIFYDWRDRTGKGWKPWREQIKEIRSPLFIGIGILLFFAIALLVGVYFYYLHPSYKNLSNKSEKVYLLPDPPEQRAVIPETGSRTMQNVKADDRLDLDSTREAQAKTPDETEDFFSSGSIPFADEVETDDSMPSVTNQEDKPPTEPTIAQLEAEIAETEKLLTEGEMIQKRAIETMNQAIPMVVDRLNTLSIAEQQAFLRQVKNQMVSLAPSEVQKLYAQDPDLADKGYELFLEKLRANGWDY